MTDTTYMLRKLSSVKIAENKVDARNAIETPQLLVAHSLNPSLSMENILGLCMTPQGSPTLQNNKTN